MFFTMSQITMLESDTLTFSSYLPNAIEYFVELSTSNKTYELENFLAWIFIDQFFPDTSLTTVHETYGQTREAYCADLINQEIPFAVARIYLHSVLQLKEAEEFTADLIEVLKDLFKIMFGVGVGLEWSALEPSGIDVLSQAYLSGVNIDLLSILTDAVIYEIFQGLEFNTTSFWMNFLNGRQAMNQVFFMNINKESK